MKCNIQLNSSFTQLGLKSCSYPFESICLSCLGYTEWEYNLIRTHESWKMEVFNVIKRHKTLRHTKHNFAIFGTFSPKYELNNCCLSLGD